jgi:hypothetical protein
MNKIIFGLAIMFVMTTMGNAYKFTPQTQYLSRRTAKNSVYLCMAERLWGPSDNLLIDTNAVNDIIELIRIAGEGVLTGTYGSCMALIDSSQALANCGSGCEMVDRVSAVLKCPVGYKFIQGSTGHAVNANANSVCYKDCPAGFKDIGLFCEKPNSEVLNTFTDELQCQAQNGGKRCHIYHVRYFVGDCKENFYRLGGSVCVPACPQGFVDHDKVCLKEEIDNGPVYLIDS